LKGGKKTEMKKILIALFLMFVLIVSVSAFWPFTKASLSPPTFPSKTLTCEGIDADQKTDVAGTINASGLLLTNNTFSITQAGTVGVNTTNSGSTLTVVGTFNASGSGTGPGLYVNGGGNVGIGVTSPNYKLQVVGTANITQGTTSFRVTSDNNIIIHLE